MTEQGMFAEKKTRAKELEPVCDGCIYNIMQLLHAQILVLHLDA